MRAEKSLRGLVSSANGRRARSRAVEDRAKRRKTKCEGRSGQFEEAGGGGGLRWFAFT